MPFMVAMVRVGAMVDQELIATMSASESMKVKPPEERENAKRRRSATKRSRGRRTVAFVMTPVASGLEQDVMTAAVVVTVCVRPWLH